MARVPLSLRISITGTAALRSFGRGVPVAVERGLFSFGKRVQNRIKTNLISGAKTGRIYRRRGIFHQASAPGEYPASDTGDLLGHIELFAGPGFLDIGSTVLHGLHLEERSPNEGGRPWLLRAIDEDGNGLEFDITKELDRL